MYRLGFMGRVTVTGTIVLLLSWGELFAEAATGASAVPLIAQLRKDVLASNSPNATAEQRNISHRKVIGGVETLSGLGESAIPALTATLEQEPDENTRTFLATALAEIPGEKAARALLSVHRRLPSLRDAVEAGLGSRLKKLGVMECRLSDDEMGVFEKRIGEGAPLWVRGAMEIVSMCTENDVSEAVAIACKRYVKQVENPEPSPASPRHCAYYLPPQMVSLSQFLQGFLALGARAIPILRRERDSCSEENVDKWLRIALAYAGDEEAAAYLENTVKNDPDRYVRYLAIRGYARAAKDKAIPLLETLKDDTTLTEYGDNPMPILRNAARGAIGMLKAGRY